MHADEEKGRRDLNEVRHSGAKMSRHRRSGSGKLRSATSFRSLRTFAVDVRAKLVASDAGRLFNTQDA